MWHTTYNNLEAFPPSTNATRVLTKLFTEVYAMTMRNLTDLAVKYLSFTFGALQVNFSCVTKAISWQTLSDVALLMEYLVRLGLAVLGTIVIYVVQFVAYWSVSFLLVTVAVNAGTRALQNVIT